MPALYERKNACAVCLCMLCMQLDVYAICSSFSQNFVNGVYDVMSNLWRQQPSKWKVMWNDDEATMLSTAVTPLETAVRDGGMNLTHWWVGVLLGEVSTAEISFYFLFCLGVVLISTVLPQCFAFPLPNRKSVCKPLSELVAVWLLCGSCWAAPAWEILAEGWVFEPWWLMLSDLLSCFKREVSGPNGTVLWS